MTRALRLALIAAGAAFGVALVLTIARADPAAFYQLGNDAFHQYRPPWRERDLWQRDGGCPVNADTSVEPDCTGHAADTRNNFALDLNKVGDDCNEPLRADRSGSTVFFTPFNGGGNYGYLLGILHTSGVDNRSSWYAHLASTSTPSSGYYAQGDFAGRASGTGATGSPSDYGCHLHFQVNTGSDRPGSGTYETVDICMAAGACPSSFGFDLQHLSDQAQTTHPSNNTGPGYGRPGAPSHLDPGPETTPLSSQINNLVRFFAGLGAETGSTLASLQGPCAANRHWVKSCSFGFEGTGYSQNFLSPPFLGLSFPRSATEGPNGAVLVSGAIWKAYGRDCQGSGSYTHALLGKPTGSEQDAGQAITQQNFSFGYIQRDATNPNSVTARVFNTQSTLLCTFNGLVDWHFGQCFDVTGDGLVDLANDLISVINRYGQSESNPSWNDRYDVNRDGLIDLANDIVGVSQHYAQVCN